eukprot:TRINITY_DN11262_c0_g1_i1.p1 TRINITY_DN11262_c0_g1~~TRINITY_DN11262_c0_g1_i1.p1  ORF type:complete len:369 (-),score=4.95 TRINITY_DN11262_c0_g1_i1:139-1245(-)
MTREILHLADNKEHKSEHCFYKISSFMKNITFQFRKYYAPSQHLSLDESMISYKGRAVFKVYIPTKPTKWGVKLHSLCESGTGYCLNFKLDPGKSIKKPSGYLYTLALELLKYNLGLYHTVYMDSYYTSIELFETLYCKNTGATGIIRKNRRGLPKEFVKQKNKEPIEFALNNIAVLTKWLDKKQLLCLSTVYGPDSLIVSTRNNKSKKVPKCISYYTKHMRGVDLMNQMIQTYRFPHRSNKWWKRVFYHGLEIAIHNSYIIWKQGQCPEDIRYVTFRETLAKELLHAGKLMEPPECHIKSAPRSIMYYEKRYVEETCMYDIIIEKTSQRCVNCKKQIQQKGQNIGVSSVCTLNVLEIIIRVQPKIID